MENLDDLKVAIPIRFQAELEARFDMRNAVLAPDKKSYIIEIECDLCTEFHDSLYECGNCPFAKFRTHEFWGCAIWLWRVLGKHHFSANLRYIIWQKKDDKIVRAEFKMLKKKADELVTWSV